MMPKPAPLDPNDDAGESPATYARIWKRQFILLAAVVAIVVLWYLFRGEADWLNHAAARGAQFRKYREAHPTLVYGTAFLIYVAVTGLAVPVATVLTLIAGWLFGFWPALALVSFASTTGASTSFLLSRYFFRDTVQQRFGHRLAVINRALELHGPVYLFALRAIPGIPFFVINIVLGLTPIRLRTYWWVSQLGMLPASAIFVYAGASVPDLPQLANQGIESILTPRLLLLLVLLGLVPIVVRIVGEWYVRSHAKTDAQGAESE